MIYGKEVKYSNNLNNIEVKLIEVMLEDLKENELGFSTSLISNMLYRTGLTMATIHIVLKMLTKKGYVYEDYSGMSFSLNGGNLFPGNKLIEIINKGE